MTTLIDLDFYGSQFFRSTSPPVRNITSATVKNAIFDELHIRERTNVDTSNIKENWKLDTRLLASFMGDLEAGNIRNNGLQIERFAIKRRKVDELKDVTLAYRDFENDKQFEYIDYTQANDEFIYSIVPISEQIEGLPNSINIKSDFCGWFLVDKDTNEVVSFDKAIGNMDDVQINHQQGRTEIQTMTRFPNVFYNDMDYKRFSLSTVIIPSEWERSGKSYERFLNNFVRNHKPFIVKGSSGEIYVADIHNPIKSSPKTTWDGNDYFTLTIDVMEVEDYEEFINQE